MGQSPLSQLLTGNTSPGDFLEMSTSPVIITLVCPGLLCYLYPQINATLCSVPLGIESEGDYAEVQSEACDAKPVYQASGHSHLQAFCAEDSGYEIDALFRAEYKAEAHKARPSICGRSKALSLFTTNPQMSVNISPWFGKTPSLPDKPVTALLWLHRPTTWEKVKGETEDSSCLGP